MALCLCQNLCTDSSRLQSSLQATSLFKAPAKRAGKAGRQGRQLATRQRACTATASCRLTPPCALCLCAVQVKSKSREVQLHKDSALGEAVLECYASGNRNVFSLGFVPVAGDNTVVLLARDTPPNSPAVRDLGVDMGQVGACLMDCEQQYVRLSQARLFVARCMQVPSVNVKLQPLACSHHLEHSSQHVVFSFMSAVATHH